MKNVILAATVMLVFGVLAGKVEMSEPLRLIAAGVAVLFAAVTIVEIPDALAGKVADRVKDFQDARIMPLVIMAQEMKGLTNGQTDLLAQYSVPKIMGVLGDDRMLWTVKFIGGDVPLDLVLTFIDMSREKEPFLWPVREHEHFAFRQYLNAEKSLQVVTDGFIFNGWAEKAGGPYPARLKRGVSLDLIEERYTSIKMPGRSWEK